MSNDLREKIVEMLEDWRKEVVNCVAAYDQGHWAASPDSTEVVADRILSLLPKLPELRWSNIWDVSYCKAGALKIGHIYRDGDVWLSWFGDSLSGSHDTEQEARAAVEKAVREALGWAKS